MVDLAVRMAVDDPDEDVGQVRERIDVVQITGFDQGGDDGPMFGTAVRSCEQRALFRIGQSQNEPQLLGARVSQVQNACKP